MMGSGHGLERGITPRLCEELFSRIAAKEVANGAMWSAKVEVQYMEIYLEQARTHPTACADPAA